MWNNREEVKVLNSLKNGFYRLHSGDPLYLDTIIIKLNNQFFKIQEDCCGDHSGCDYIRPIRIKLLASTIIHRKYSIDRLQHMTEVKL